MKKSIYWHFPHFLYWMGGTRFLLDIAQRFNDSNLELIFICNNGNDSIINTFRKNNKVITTSFLTTNSIFYWLLFPIFIIWDIIISSFYLSKADYIIATAFPSNLICAVYSFILNKKYYFYCYEPFIFFHNRDFINRLPLAKKLFVKFLALLYGNLDMLASKKAYKIFTIDAFKAQEIQLVYNVKPIITSLGVDTNHFRFINNKKINNLFKGRPIILHSTDYTELKRTDLAIMAFNELVKKIPNIILLITSTQPNSPNKKKYQNLVKTLHLQENVKFLGTIPYKELPLYYSSAICYISSCHDKITAGNWPVKESLACETPAIRSPIATRDVIDGISGFLVDPKNIKLVANKIEFLVKNPNLAHNMGKQGRKFIRKEYNWDNIINKILINL